MSSKLLDFMTNGRSFTIQNGSSSDTSTVFRIKNNNGDIVVTIKGNGQANIQGLPTSSAGLSSGDLWNSGGFIKIV